MGRGKKGKSRTSIQKAKPPAAYPASQQAPPLWRRAITRVTKFTKTTWAAVGVAGTLVGLVVTYVTFFEPQLSIQPGKQLDFSRPFSYTFEITNNGNLPVSDLTYRGMVNRLTSFGTDGSGKPGPALEKCGTSITHLEIPKLERGEKTTVAFPFPIGPQDLKIKDADIEFVVGCRDWFGIKRERLFRFAAASDSDERLTWHPIATSVE